MPEKKLSRRVVKEHGLISNILPALILIDQLTLSYICRRTHDITVPWNIFSVPIPQDLPDSFPKIDDVSDEFVCKRVKAKIEGEKGWFYGSVRKWTGLPDGLGVFVTGPWLQCGKVKDGLFDDGRRVSINK